MNDPNFVILIQSFDGDSTVTVEGIRAWEWVVVGDTVNNIFPWQSANIPSGEAALTGLIRTRTHDAAIARMDTISEWSHALGQFIPGVPGTTNVYATWFGTSEDTIRVIVHPWIPSRIAILIGAR